MKQITRHLIVATLCFGTLSAFAATTFAATMDKEDSSDIANKESPQQVEQAKSATDRTDNKMKSKKMHHKKKMHQEMNNNSMNDKPMGTTTDQSTVNPNDAVNGKKY